MFRRNFGETCRVLRERCDLTQEELAFEMDCATSTISRIENGIAYPHGRTAEKLVDIFGEKRFFDEYTLGVGQRDYHNRQRLKRKWVDHYKRGEYEKLKETMENFKQNIRDWSVTDKQSFLLMQQLWVELKDDAVEKSSKKYEEMLKMKCPLDIDLEEMSLGGIELTYAEQVIINNIGLSYMEEGKPKKACKLYKVLCDNLYDKGKDNPWYLKHLAEIFNNRAIACIEAGRKSEACEYVNRVLACAIHRSSCETVLMILRTKVLVLEKCGRGKEAEELEVFLEKAGTACFGMTGVKGDNPSFLGDDTTISVL